MTIGFEVEKIGTSITFLDLYEPLALPSPGAFHYSKT